jgi:hypothetical protein
VPPADEFYVEKLAVRPVWWLVACAVATLGAVELAAGFRWQVWLVVLAAALVPTVGILLGVGRLVVRVDTVGLHAGGRTMTFDDMESAESLDREQTRLRVGPESDPAAHLVFRGYVAESVLVRPLRSTPVPYWLVSSRHPEKLVAAIERAARAAYSTR